MDVNLLPDELRKREEEELRRQANRPIEVPMSSPLKEEDKKQTSLPVGSNKGQPAKSHEPHLPAAREKSFIHQVTPTGKILHETVVSLRPGVRSGQSWWKKLLNLLRSLMSRGLEKTP